MTIDELKKTALALPLVPGVYIMRDVNDRVIYIGKAKKLKNRVSQYFQDTASHTPKTQLMVSLVDHFDVIVAASEFEALVLECSLIKQHMPKYNILLKDDKGYPYVRLDMRVPYPALQMVNKIDDDGAEYFGPFGSRGSTNHLLKTIRQTLKLPSCNKKFPRDIGKDRVCLNYHMGQCAGWCQRTEAQSEYRALMEQVRQLLRGNYKTAADSIRKQMLSASDSLNFELAATLRDRLVAIETLGKKQLVTAGTMADMDVIGYARTEAKACFTVLHYSDGNLLDKDFALINTPDDDLSAISSLVMQYYADRNYFPRLILLPMEFDDMELLQQMLSQKLGRKVTMKMPRRGVNVQYLELANKNALEEAQRSTERQERTNVTLSILGKMLGIDLPHRIESFDISNISGTDIVSSMVVFQDGKPKKSHYKRFKIQGLADQDDYASMYQTIIRRFSHYIENDGTFSIKPDLLLIDGGVQHAQTAQEALKTLDLSFPVFGMVKDDRHRTRALVTPDGREIRIDNQQSIFALIGTIQEETHRFAIQYHRKLRSKRLKYSQLDEIPGVGQTRKELLLKKYKSVKAIAAAELFELEQILPRAVALSVFNHFRNSNERVDG